MSCHAVNKPQGWCTSLAFVAISQRHFYNNSISYFPGGLWLTVPEKITGSLLLSKMKGVGLSPAKCGEAVEEGKHFMEAPSKTPWLWNSGGKAEGVWALVPSSGGTGLATDSTGRLCTALPSARLREGWCLPWGSVAGCHQGLEGKKWLLCVFSTVVEFYGMALLFLQHWLWTNKRRQFIS